MHDDERRVPADRGLSGLGLLMQLAGGVFSAVSITAGIGMVMAAAPAAAMESDYDDAPSSGLGKALLWMMILAGTSLVRSSLHRRAGSEILYGQQPLAAIRRYVIAGVVNVAAWAWFLLSTLGASWSIAAPWLIVLAAWPVALAVISRLPELAPMAEGVPISEDKGFEGASILMAMFGLLGLLWATVSLYTLWEGSAGRRGDGLVVLVFASLLMLVIRSGLHVAAAMRGLRETHLDRAVEATNRYADFAVIASFVVAGAILLGQMMTAPQAAGLVQVTMIAWLLLAWPLAIRRFYGERQFADLMATEGELVHRRAPDGGLTTLGWFLFAQALITLALLVPAAIWWPDDGGTLGLLGADQVASLLAPASAHSSWWFIALMALQLWAGIELIRMGELHRAAATAFGVIAIAANLYLRWDAITDLSRFDPLDVARLAMVLVIPGATLLLANRSLVPAATARIRR